MTETFCLENATGERIELRNDIALGSDPTDDITIEDPKVAKHHARLTVGSRTVLVRDLGSAEGTYVNGARIEADTVLHDQDEIRVGDSIFRFLREGPAPTYEPSVEMSAFSRRDLLSRQAQPPLSWADPSVQGTRLLSPDDLRTLLASSAPSAPPGTNEAVLHILNGGRQGDAIRLDLTSDPASWDIGRDAQREICIPEASVSNYHARLQFSGGRLKLVDQMSSNGTLVNEKRSTVAYLSSGDRIRIGAVEIELQIGPRRSSRVISVEAKSQFRLWAVVLVSAGVTGIVLSLILLAL